MAADGLRGNSASWIVGSQAPRVCEDVRRAAATPHAHTTMCPLCIVLSQKYLVPPLPLRPLRQLFPRLPAVIDFAVMCVRVYERRLVMRH